MRSLGNIKRVAHKLSEYYKDFGHHNKKNPLNELLYIICSLKTRENRYSNSYYKLKKLCPKFEDLEKMKIEDFQAILHESGLSNQKAKNIKVILESIKAQFGKITLSPLKKYSEKECEAFLTSLPGVGLKTARCVMLMALKHKVYPVDTHCWRIANRLEWIKSKKTFQNCRVHEMNSLQNIIPKNLRYSLHVNFVSLGREFCLALNPKCKECPIQDDCPSRI